METSSSSASASSSCFICGEAISNRIGPRRGRRPNNFKSLKELVRRLCEILGVEVTKEDWGYLEELEEENVELICCEKCVEILRNVDKVQEVILKAQRELKEYLDEVQSLIVRSECQGLKSSLWWRGCYDLRRSILNKIAPSPSSIHSELNDRREGSEPPVDVHVKEEREGHDQSLLDDHFDDNWDLLQMGDGHAEDEQAKSIGNSVDFSETSVKFEEPVGQGRDASDCDLVILPAKRRGRKRKITVIAADDIPGKSAKVGRASSSRAAKISAEKALKVQYESNGASDYDGDTGDNHQDDLDNSNNQSEASADEEDGGVSDASIPNSKKDKCKEKVKHKTKNKMTKVQIYDQPDSTAPFGRTCCGVIRKNPKKHPFFPFVVAKEDLFLYRYDTFVTKTYTHLYCQAYKCDFFTEFDYYSSFQTMKAHLDKCHRHWTHRQKKPHPCLLCNIVLKNREELWNHCKAHHNDEIFKSPKGICESCLQPIILRYTKTHQFSHKNQEEKQEARELNDAPAKCLKPSEREITERKYICNYENCTMAFKNLQNLRRHKQIHLPMELRTDRTLCPECGKNILKEDFRVHMEKFHHPETVEGVLICKYCDKRFHPIDKTIFKAHLKRHQGEKTHLCPECGAAYYSTGGLHTHIKDAHRNSDPTPCKWCGKIYTKDSSLRKHMASKHPEEASKKIRSKFYSTEEVKGGDFIGPIQKFPCQHCDILCSYAASLKRHMARAHQIGTWNWTSNNKRRLKIENQQS